MKRRFRPAQTEVLEVRQLLTGDFVFGKLVHSGFDSSSGSGLRLTYDSKDMAVDNAGSTLVAAREFFEDFETPELTDIQAIVTKHSPTGTEVWRRSLSSVQKNVSADSIAVDSLNNVYVTGTFTGIVDFDPGAGTTTLDSTAGSGYLWKLNSAGNFLWVRQLAGPFATNLAVSPAGNAYVTGKFQGTYDFDNGPGVTELTTATPGSYVLKYNSAGTLNWARQFSSSDFIETGLTNDSLEVDSNENLYVAGRFRGTTDLDPGSGTFTTESPTAAKTFLTKLNSSGDLSWAIVQDSQLSVKGIGVDGSGNVFLTGTFSGVADLNPGPVNVNLTSLGAQDIYLLKLNSSGGYAWSRRIGGTNSEFVAGLDLDSSGNIYTTGVYSGTVDFNPTAGTFDQTSILQNPFVLKLTSSGGFGWVRTFESAFGNSGPTGIAVDSNGQVTTAGWMNDMLDLDPGLPTQNQFSESGVYLSRLSPDFLYQTTAAGADDIVLRKSGSNLQIFDKVLNQVVDSHPLSQIRKVIITGQASQADTLTIDMAFGGAFGINNGITFEGGSGANNKIQIVGVSGQTALYRPSVTTGGTDNLQIGSTPLDIKQTQDVVISGVTTLNVQTQGSADTLSLDPGNGINNAVASKLTGNSSGSFLRPLTFHNVQDVIIDTGALDAATTGNDKITISTLGLRAVGMKNLTLSTGIGNDTLTVSSALQLPVASGALTFQAGTGTDTLNAQGDTNWTLTNTNLTSGAGGVLQLTGVENATLTGGASNNILNASLFSGNVTFYGRAGNDTLNGGTGVNHFVLEGTHAADHLELVKTRTGAAFRRRNRTNGLLLETDTITSPGTMQFTVKALNGDDLISIDSLFTQAGTVDGGLGIDTCTAPGHWTKISC